MASPRPSVSFGLGGSVRLGGGQELTPPRDVLPARAAFALLPKSSAVRWSAYPQGRGEVPEREPGLLPGTRALGSFLAFLLGSGTRKVPRTGALCRCRPCVSWR